MARRHQCGACGSPKMERFENHRFTIGHAGARILITEFKGATGIVTTRLIANTLAMARQENARYPVMQLDASGGLGTATSGIIQHFLTSLMPVIVYLTSGGACGVCEINRVHAARRANSGTATPIELDDHPGLLVQRELRSDRLPSVSA